VRALFVQQDHLSPTGPVGDRFLHHGYEIVELLVVPPDRFASPGVTVSFPDPRDFDAIVAMGAPWSVYDVAAIGSWIGAEQDFLRAAHEAGVPVLGICFGGQALAAALGGSVQRAPGEEIGWYDVDSDEHALVGTGPWFQWHYDQFTPPPGSTTFASTPLGPQAYRIGRSLGLQFHPEIPPGQLVSWLDNGGDAELEAHGIDRDALVRETTSTAAVAAARTHALVDAFLQQVAARPAEAAH
jgi:GMP synthase-like glutamine amidotransferase